MAGRAGPSLGRRQPLRIAPPERPKASTDRGQKAGAVRLSNEASKSAEAITGSPYCSRKNTARSSRFSSGNAPDHSLGQ